MFDPYESGAGADPISRPEYVAIVAIDLIDPARITATMGAAEQYRLFDEYFSLTRGVIESHGGTVLNGYGTAIFVAFPFKKRVRALEFAVASQMAVREHNESASTVIAVGVGLALGRIETGRLGSFGPPLLMAAGLCCAAGASKILASDALYRKAVKDDPRLPFNEPSYVQVAGRRTVRAHELGYG